MPPAILRQRGDSIDYTPGADVAAGTVVVLAASNGKTHGIAERAIPANTLGALSLVGVYEVDCLTTDVIAIGAPLFWDAGNSRATLTASTHGLLGVAVSAAGNGTTRVYVRLNQATTIAG